MTEREFSLIDERIFKKRNASGRSIELQLSTFLDNVPKSDLSLVSFEIVPTEQSAPFYV